MSRVVIGLAARAVLTATRGQRLFREGFFGDEYGRVLGASVTSTEASAGSCGATTRAAPSRRASPSDDGGLASPARHSPAGGWLGHGFVLSRRLFPSARERFQVGETLRPIRVVPGFPAFAGAPRRAALRPPQGATMRKGI